MASNKGRRSLWGGGGVRVAETEESAQSLCASLAGWVLSRGPWQPLEVCEEAPEGDWPSGTRRRRRDVERF